MKIKVDKVITNLSGKPMMADQTVEVVNGAQQLVGGHPMKVGDVLAALLSQKKTGHFNPLKAYALAMRIYDQSTVDIDEGDLQGLRAMVEESDAFIPLIIAQVLKALIEQKDNADLNANRKKR